MCKMLSPVYRPAVMVLLMALVVVGSTGCAWFKKKDTREVTPPAEFVPQDTDAQVSEGAVPPNAEREGFAPGELSPLPQVETVYFDYDKANIRADQVEKMQANLKFLLDNAAIKVYIVGHTDERGTNEYNFNLGNERAKAAADFFIQGGVAADRIATVSRGEEEPAVAGHDDSAWSMNRRAEFFEMH